MARVPAGFGIDDVMGVRRPDRSVSLPSPELQRAGFDFDEFDRLISEGVSEAEQNPWDLVEDPVTGELVERDTVGSPTVLEVESGWRNHPRYAGMTDEEYVREIDREFAAETADIHREQRADLGITAQDEANLSETVERILAEQGRPVGEPWSNEDWEFLHTAIRDEIRYGQTSEQPSVFTNPDHTRWDVEVALEIEEQITPPDVMDERDRGLARSQGLSDAERARMRDPGGFIPPDISGLTRSGGHIPPDISELTKPGRHIPPDISMPNILPGPPIRSPQRPTILSMGGQESLPGMTPEELRRRANLRGVADARTALGPPPTPAEVEERRLRANPPQQQPVPPPMPPNSSPMGRVQLEDWQRRALIDALLMGGAGAAGFAGLGRFGGGGMMGGLSMGGGGYATR